MTRLARAGNIGGLGASGLAAGCAIGSPANRFSFISDASAITPMPVPQLRKNCRRVMDLSQRSCVAVIVFAPLHAVAFVYAQVSGNSMVTAKIGFVRPIFLRGLLSLPSGPSKAPS